MFTPDGDTSTHIMRLHSHLAEVFAWQDLMPSTNVC